jgi:hypothetical protein
VSEEIRPEVVEAIVRAMTHMDPTVLLEIAHLGVTPAERRAADDLMLVTMTAPSDHQARTLKAMELLLHRRWTSPPSWRQLFDDVTPEIQAQLEDLYDALPDGARAEYDRRYGRPSL